MKDEKQVTMKNGRQAISGTCTVCGTKMFKIGGGGSTAKPLPRIKAARNQLKKELIRQRQKQKLRENNL
jgi:hypothetical protein